MPWKKLVGPNPRNTH